MIILWAIVVGLVVGAAFELVLGKEPHEGRSGPDLIIRMLLGIAGSLVAGFIWRSMGFKPDTDHDLAAAFNLIGASALLFFFELMVRRPTK